MSGELQAANNLSDLNNAGTARTNLGLGNVDNTSDANKPVSTATQTALNAKAAGAASSTDNAIARFHETTGKIIQNSGVTVDDSNNLLIPNNVSYQAKQAGGTAKSLIKLGSDDLMRVSQQPHINVTTASVQENIVDISGWAYTIGTGSSASNTLEVTYGFTFGSILSASAVGLGHNGANTPTAMTDFSSAHGNGLVTFNGITTTSATLRYTDGVGTNLVNGRRYGFAWSIKGTKA